VKSNLELLKDELIQRGKELHAQPRYHHEYTGEAGPDKLINELDATPIAFVFGCVLDRQIPAKKAWRIPFTIREKIGSLDVGTLSALDEKAWIDVMMKPEPLHRFSADMAVCLYQATQTIRKKYNGDATAIWNDRPSSARLIRRFLEFKGVGQKISTMAANILARDFKIPMSDYYSIDISVDVHIKRLFKRMGFVESADNEIVVYAAREMYPSYPGIFDSILWDLGREYCRPENPACDRCPFGSLCPKQLGVEE